MREPSVQHHYPQRQAGFTLLELLIALAIGILLMTSVLLVMSNSSRGAKASEADAVMSEEAMLVLNLLQQQIRMAGYSNTKEDSGVMKRHFSGTPIFGCDTGFADLSRPFDDLTCAATGSSAAIALRYEADNLNTIPTSAGVPTNCVGGALQNTTVSEVTGGGNIYLSDARYVVTTNTPPELACQAHPGTGSPALQPLIENVESVQFWYGVASSNSRQDTQIVTYRTATQLDNDPAPGGTSRSHKWGKVLSVKICVLMRSPDPLLDGSSTSKKYIDCAGALVDAPDNHMRRAFITTAQVRNRAAMPLAVE